jgi:hypothetical protein
VNGQSGSSIPSGIRGPHDAVGHVVVLTLDIKHLRL